MQYSEKVSEAARHIMEKVPVLPKTAIILGSGLGGLADKIEDAVIVPYAEIPFWPRSTAPGHAGRLVIGQLAGHTVAAMQGRVHFYEGYSMTEVTFPIRVLGSLGVKTLVVTNASGGVNTSLAPGSIVNIVDHINLMGTNPLIGPNNDEWGARFPDMTHAYAPELISALERAAKNENIKIETGVYLALSGPSFETPSEIRMARTLGADVVGMSTVPEVITANHMGIKVCGLSCVANAAAGITGNALTHQEVLDMMNQTADKLCTLIEAFLKETRE